MSAPDLCRKHDIGNATFDNRRRKYGSVGVTGENRLQLLEFENKKLKKVLAQQMVNGATLKNMLEKNLWDPVHRGRPWIVQ